MAGRRRILVALLSLASCATDDTTRPPIAWPGSCCVAVFPPGTRRDQVDAIACVAEHVVEGCQRIDCVTWSAWVCSDGRAPLVVRPYPGGVECTCAADDDLP